MVDSDSDHRPGWTASRYVLPRFHPAFILPRALPSAADSEDGDELNASPMYVVSLRLSSWNYSLHGELKTGISAVSVSLFERPTCVCWCTFYTRYEEIAGSTLAPGPIC